MRNGQGDQMLILFQNGGSVINGMAYEYYPKDKSDLTKELPEIFHEFIFGEPVNSIGTTFCVWSISESGWETGKIEDFDDGSEEMLRIFDDNPQTYIDWATDYYEDGFLIKENTYKVVAAIYQGNVLTKGDVLTLVEELGDWGQLIKDLEEIKYPYRFTE